MSIWLYNIESFVAFDNLCKSTERMDPRYTGKG